ncbi:MAG: hypothetical protein N3A38_05165 [Planctomycetota bacterium]|nr:hypothetical protein [Planctomycetota bacterium]
MSGRRIARLDGGSSGTAGGAGGEVEDGGPGDELAAAKRKYGGR